MLESIKTVIMRRDGLPEDIADCLIEEARELVNQHFNEGELLSAENVIYDYFSLEPDYLMELIEW